MTKTMAPKLEPRTLDARDPLRASRDRFHIPDGLIYLDGNSLGMMPKHVPARVQQAVTQEWGNSLIRSWNTHDWINLPARVGAKIARLIGAQAHEVIACDSISVNLFKLLVAATRLRPDRRVLVSDIDNFPTDLYIAQGLNTLLEGRFELRFVKRADLETAIKDDVAVVMLTEVDYRTGERLDMRALTAKAHDVGALTIWDLAHSAGAFPVHLNDCNADFAVGCGYKYLNGGPGSPAFLMVADRHLEHTQAVLSGWMGHAAPFAFDPWYAPDSGVRRLTAGTPGVLGMTALEAALEVFDNVDLEVLRAKSLALTDLFMTLMQPLEREYGFACVTPQRHEARGSQVSYMHEHGYAVMQALIASNVIGDFRAPDIVRFGFTPLYTSFADVEEAVRRLEAVMRSRAYLEPRFQQRAAVT
jgi:kynureninase